MSEIDAQVENFIADARNSTHPTPAEVDTARDLLGDQIQPQALNCYRVGDSDYFAAESPEQALQLMHDEQGFEEPHEVDLVTGARLDERWTDPDEPGEDAGSIREWLQAAVEPGWIGGTEG